MIPEEPYERVEHWMDNAIAFSSVARYQLMNCPVVVDAMIEGFKVRRIYVDGGSSTEIMYEHCFRNISYRTRSRLSESQNPLRLRKEPMQLDDVEERRQPDKGKKLPKFSVEENIVTPADMTGIPRAIMEHILDTNPHIEPKVQKKKSLALDRRKVMTKKDEEKTTFHTEERVFCYTKMPFGLKNTGVTYQRLVDSAFKEQIGVNLEAYVDDMVIKSRTEQDIIKDIEQTFSTLRRINMKLNPKKCSFSMEEGKFLGYIVTSEGIRGNPEKTKAVMDMPSPKTLKLMQSLSRKLTALNHFLSKSAERSLPFLDTLKKCTNKKDFRWTEATEVALLEMKKLVSELPTLTTLKKGETLMMYLATADEAVSAVLLTEIDGRKMSIHYVSRSLQGVETNYALMEKLTLALVHAARPLRRIAVKGQVLADFLADASIEINVAPVVASTLRVEDILGSSNAMEDLTLGPRAWRLNTDEASNNGGSRAGLILIAPDDVKYSYVLRLNFSNSNNDAEYEAPLDGLQIATEMQVKYIHAFVDSKLVASQVEGSYKAKGERMIKYQEKVLELDGAFNRFRITRIPRVENRKAGALSKLAAVQFDHLSKEVLVEVLNEGSIEAQEVNMVVEEEGPTWMTQIQNYLEKRMLPEDPVDARTLMEKIRSYTMEDGVLYRKSYLVSLMRCIGPLQANYVIIEVHMGSCKMCDGLRQVVAKAINLGYYWPSMHRDARELIRACDDCQAHASVPRLPKANMISVTLAWPFMKWGMDIVGPLSEGPRRVKYLIVATDYFTKWMEAKPLATITGRQVVNFTWDNIGNEAVERANRSLLKGIKTRLEKGGSAWDEEVLNVLWAHQTMKKTSNGETPFSLTCGTEAVIPAEISMPTQRMSKLNEKH
ncbi:reverse transcriptase domain-containing protein [Tanacetum coccineum]